MTYWPHPELAYNGMTLVARTIGDPLSHTAAITREIQAIDKDQPVSDVRTMDQWVARTLAQARFSSMLLTAFAAVALLLAAIGIYGVLSYAVNLRAPEIGIRLALGAQRRDIVLMVLRNAATLTLIGLAAGVGLAFALTRAVASLLYGVTPTDPVTFAVVVGVLVGVAVAATYLPARRASRIAPVEALRYQ
jgi:putative ABC transport system permease protein